MIGRVVLLAGLALVACKKDKSDERRTRGNAEGGAEVNDKGGDHDKSGDRAPTEDKRMNDSQDWTQRTGMGFTISAPHAATVEHVTPEDKRDHPFDRYTFYKANNESFVVEVTELAADANVSREVLTLRDRVANSSQAKRSEDFLDGEVPGRDLRYLVDEGDDTLKARSKIVAKGTRMFEVRAVCQDDTACIAAGDRFVDSFAFAP